MMKESNRYKLWQRFGSLLLTAVLILGMLPGHSAAASAAVTAIGEVTKLADPETLTRPQDIYGDNTLNAGKITVGKSVSKDAITVDGHQIGLLDENNFLITVSQSAQVMGLSSESSVPVDVVFVLDTSGSMNSNGRAESLVTAANSAIKTLMATNEQNRVAVVAFSSEGDYGGGSSGGAAANVLSSLAHYNGDAANAHLQWVDANGNASGNSKSYIAGRDEVTITVTEQKWVPDDSSMGGHYEYEEVTKQVVAYRNGKNGGTNIQAGIVAGAKILTDVQDTTWTNPETNEVVHRIPFLIIISDGQPTYSYDDDTWYDPDITGDDAANEQGPGFGAYEGNGFITAMTAAYYKGKITEHYYGDSASVDNRCFVYTMGVELEALDDSGGQSVVGDEQSLSQITLDPVTYASGSYAASDAQSYYRYGNTWNENNENNRSTTHSFMTYWSNYVAGTEFNVRVNSNQTFKFTSASIEDSKKYVNGVGYSGGMHYNDDYFSVDDVDQMEEIFKALISEISKKAISAPTKVSTGDHEFDGYVTFTDPLGEYMELKAVKGFVSFGKFYQGTAAAQLMATGANAEFNAAIRRVLKIRLGVTDSDDRFATEAELNAFVESLLATADGNSITWWGNEYHTGEEDVQVQVIAAAQDDSIAYIEAQKAAGNIPEGVDYVCRSYFFGSAGSEQELDYLSYVIRVQRSIHAPYQQTVVVSAPASLLSVEKVMVNESFDDNGNPSYTVSVEKAPPVRVVYEVGLWDTINEETVSTIVSESYRKEAVNGEGQVNYDEVTDTYYFFTNDWNRGEDDADHHHRAMAKATFDAAADNAFYTYQEDTLLVDASGKPVTSDPRNSKAYYVRTYYDWSGSALNNGTYAATKKTQLVEVDLPGDAELVQKDGKWYIRKGIYTASTLIVNGDDAEKSENTTKTTEVVAHPHRTDEANHSNSHYTVLLGNNGSISLKSNIPKPEKTVSNTKNPNENADGKVVMIDDVLEYTITAENYSAESGTLIITDTVPAGTVFVSADHGVTPDANGKLTWKLENVAAGAEVYVSFKVKVTAAALDNAVVTSTIQNTATVKLNNGPEYKTNTTSNPPSGKKVTIQNDVDGASVQVGDILEYAIEYHNDTGAVAPVVTIVDKLPAGTSLVTVDHQGVYDAQHHTITWTFTNVAPGAGGVVTFTVQVDSSAKTAIENSANINIGNNSYTTNKTSAPLDTGKLELTKEVQVPAWYPTGHEIFNKTFTLTLTDPSGKMNGQYSDVTFTNGVAMVEIKHGQTITIEGIATGTTIYVSESVPAGFRVAYSNSQVVIPANNKATVAVTNIYSVTNLEVLLQGSKTLTGNSPDDERFGFTVVPCNDAGTVTPGATGITGEVTLTSGTKAIVFGKLTFDKPGTYHYLVSEVNGGQTGVTYTQVQYLVTIQVTDKGDGTMDHTMSVKTRNGSTGAFGDYTGTTMLFTNEYKPLSTSITLEGHKTLNGRDLKAGEFSFVVTEKINGVDTVVSTGTNGYDANNDGVITGDELSKIVFMPITYTETGDHVYVISELKGNLSGVTYATTTYTVTVKVNDVNGQLVATATGANGIEFENRFEPDEVAVTLVANKVLTGATLKDSQFSFVVYQKDDNGNLIKDSRGNPVVVASGSNDANGKITFSKIEYFLADLGGASSKTFRYQISELVHDSGVDPSMYYDDLVIDVSVTVTYDPSTGTLSVADPVYSADTTFNNIDNPNTIIVIPEGTKTTTGIDGVRFSFSVVDVDTNAVVSSGTSGVNGNITFAGITYDYDDLGEHYYWITEDQGGTTSAGITYDGTKYLMVVTIGLDSTRGLTKNVQYYTVIENGDYMADTDRTPVTTASFSNTYSVTTGTTVILEFNKVLSNRVLKAGEFEFGLYHNGNLVATTTNGVDLNNDGQISGEDELKAVRFVRNYAPSVLGQYDADDGTVDKKATIQYVVKELNKGVHGITYAANEVPVDVQIEDNGQGGLKDPVITYEVPNTFTNTYTPNPAEVILTGTKELTGATLLNGQFSFVVKEGNTEVAWGSNDANGTITFTKIQYTYAQYLAKQVNGEAKFVYTVKEVIPDIGADPNMYYDPAVHTVTVTVTYNASTGMLTATPSDLSGVIFNNIQNPDYVAFAPAGQKTTTGANLPGGLMFSFRVYSVNASGEHVLEGTGTSLPTVEGDPTAKNIVFTDLVITDEEFAAADTDHDRVATFTFYIEESNTGNAQNGVTYDNSLYRYEVTVTRNATNQLTVSPGTYAKYVDGQFVAVDQVTFNNNYAAKTHINLTAQKSLTDKTLADKAFDFRLQRLDPSGRLISGSAVNGHNNAAGLVTFATLNYGSHMLQTGYEKNGAWYFSYLMSEIEPATAAIPGVTYDKSMYIVTVKVTRDAQGAMSAELANVSHAVVNGDVYTPGTSVTGFTAGGDTKVTFTNEYRVTTGTQVTMEVYKVLTGRALQAGEFEFGLYHDNRLVAIAKNGVDLNNDGQISGEEELRTVRFVREYAPSVLGQYDAADGRIDQIAPIQYVIKELNNNLPNVAYSENGVTVNVKLTHNNQGALVANVESYVGERAFTNTYTPDPVEVALEAKKVLTGRDLVAEEFQFVVLEGNTEVAWGKNDASGKIVFSDLVFDYEDMKNDAGEYLDSKTFTYTVEEVIPDISTDPSLYYDPATYTVSITVRYDRVSGELTADAPVITPNGEPGSTMTFNNVDHPDTIIVTPQGTKTTAVISGTIPADTRFSYTIYALNDAGERGAVVGAGTSGINGDITFSTLLYDFNDVGKTFKYVIVEDNGGTTNAGITYDAASFEMTVVISAVDNELFADVSYSASVAFRNEYKITQPATVTMEAVKDLTGRDLRPGEFGFNLYHIHNNVETLIAATTNGYDSNNDGQFTSDEIRRITFSRTYDPSILLGEHKQADGTAVIYYVIREQVNNLGGVDYSAAAPVYVKVTITPGTNGTMQAVPTYYSDEHFTTEMTNPAITNSYETTDTFFKPEVDKVLNGRHMVDDEFSFVIREWNGTTAGNAVSYGLSKAEKSGVEKTIVFNNMIYTYQQFVANKNADGEAVFTYEISEIPGNLVNVGYTDAKIYLKVTVKDLGNGELKTTGEYFSDELFQTALTNPVFENSYTPIGTTVVLNADKALTGREAIDGEFSFRVLYGDTVVATGGNYGGSVLFSGIGISATAFANAPKNSDGNAEFVFAMEELNTNQGAVTFDTNTYYAKVVVKNNLATGRLEVVSTTYYSDELCQNPLNAVPEFVNEYAPAPVTVEIPVHKVLLNHTLKAGQFVFQLSDDSIVMQKSNDEHGNAVFALSYDVDDLNGVAAGQDNVRTKVFTYTIKEMAGTPSPDDNGTYTYDETVYTVTVTVIDDGKGNLSADVKIRKDQTAVESVTFTNSFTPDPIKVNLDTAIDATKTVVDDEGNRLENKLAGFRFRVLDLNGNPVKDADGNDMIGVSDANGNIHFADFTFSVEGEYRYLLSEITPDGTGAPDGMTYDTTVWCVHIRVRYNPDDGKLSVSDNDVYTHILTAEGHAADGIQAQAAEAPVFTNVYDAADVSLHLTLDKTMTGDRTEVKEHEFLFQLRNADGTLAGEARNHHDGVANFYLVYTLQDLNGQPSRDFVYTIKEVIPSGAVENADGTYTLNGVTYDNRTHTITVTLSDNGKGKLVTQLNGDVVSGTVDTGIDFVNSYHAADVTVAFNAIKRMEGMPLENGVYTFYLMDGDEILLKGHNNDRGVVTFNKTITYTEPGTYTYTMVEYKDSKPGVTFDETSFKVTVEVTDNGRGNLEAKVIYTTETGIYDQPVFINIYKPAGISVAIEAQKELNGRELKDEFTFQLVDGAGTVVSQVQNDAQGKITFDIHRFSTAGTYLFTIREVIPAEAVKNADGTYTWKGVTYDLTTYTVVVEITDHGFDGQLDKKVTYYLGTQAVDAAKVKFTNSYTTTDSNKIVIDGSKVLENQTLAKETFQFQLKDSQGNILQTKTHDADGKFVFDGLTYTFADLAGETTKVFTYTVSEVQGKLGGVTYDKTVYTVKVTVTDNGDGTLTAVAAITGGKNDGKIAFTNVYKANAASTDVTAKKELSGKKLEEGQFTFALVNANNKEEAYTATNKADGSITFRNLTFSAAGTYVYELYEVKGDDGHITYDDTVYAVTITVVDNGDGTMTATPAYSKTPVFRNTHTPDSIVVVLEGSKNLTGRDLADGEFEFEVRDDKGNLVTTGTNKADGTIVFQQMVISSELELVLNVSEVKGTDKQIEYDDYIYRVKLTVTNDNGVLKADVQYLDGDIVFYNEYEVPETPPTGDDTPLFLYMGLMFTSAAALMAMLVLGRKKKENK